MLKDMWRCFLILIDANNDSAYWDGHGQVAQHCSWVRLMEFLTLFSLYVNRWPQSANEVWASFSAYSATNLFIDCVGLENLQAYKRWSARQIQGNALCKPSGQYQHAHKGIVQEKPVTVLCQNNFLYVPEYML